MSTPAITGTRISRLQVDYFKRTVSVDIMPQGNVIEVRGPNAQGKTSILDAIRHAAEYKAAKNGTSRPIHDGADKASIIMTLDDGVTISRVWTDNDKPPTFKVESADGLRYPSPQKLIDEVIGSLSFDPLAFANAPVKDQLKLLLDVVDLPFDPDELTAKRKELFDSRTAVNRRVKELEAQVAAMPVPSADLPLEEISSASVLAELRAVEDRNRGLVSIGDALQGARDEASDLGFDGVVGFVAQAIAALPERGDVQQFQDKLTNLEATNAQIRTGAARRQLVGQLTHFTDQANGLTASIEALDAGKAAAMRAAKLPIPDLGFDDDGVTYQGVPFSQASAAEQLRVSIAMAMALNPGLRVLRVTDASLLDATSRALVEQMADTNDYQIWLEVVADAPGEGNGTVSFFIEDGSVVTA